jgi:ATP-dependent metalloprotease FtsH
MVFFPAYVVISLYENYSMQGYSLPLQHRVKTALRQDDSHEINVNKENEPQEKEFPYFKGKREVTANNLAFDLFTPSDILTDLKDLSGYSSVKPKAQLFVNLLNQQEAHSKVKANAPKGLILYGVNDNNADELALSIGKSWAKHVIVVDAVDVNGWDIGRLRISDLFSESINYAPTVIIIKNIDYIMPIPHFADFSILQPKERLYKFLDDIQETNQPVLIVGITHDIYKIDPSAFLPGRFENVIFVDYPNLSERVEIFQSLLKMNNIKQVDPLFYAKKTDGYSREYLKAMVNQSKIIATKNKNARVDNKIFEEAFVAVTANRAEMMEKTKLAAGSDLYQLISPNEINSKFSDISGQEAAKEKLEKVIKDIHDNKKKAQGILLYGPPGTGKTTLARAFAGEANTNFINVSGSEFITRWVGEGATRIRKLFEFARNHRPCVIFIDEFDALGVKRTDEGSGSAREEAHIVNQLLSELDNLDEERNSGVYIIAATNRLHVIDEALMRPGRFDLKIELTLPNEAERKQFIERLLNENNISLAFNITEAVKLTKGFSQAELDSLFAQSIEEVQKQKKKQLTRSDLENFIGEINQHMMSLSKAEVDLAFEIYRPSQLKANFKSIIGLDDVKKELSQMSFFLDNSEKLDSLGVKIPKGWIFYGPPGTGKTSLARALAGESGVTFITTTGSAFVEQWVGLGAQRVRELFAIARDYKPCIVFIDEIDALAMKRSSEAGSSQEYAQTVNEFLAELDNIDSDRNAGIVVIGATNRIDNIDEAVLRPGRLGKKIYIRLPTLVEREQLLKLFLSKIKIPNSVELKKLSGATIGFSGADLENLVNETALSVIEKSGNKITMYDIEQTKENILYGRSVISARVQPKEKERTAYHEAGHALVGIASTHYPYKFYKITLNLRDETLGITHFYEEEEHYSQTRLSLMDIISTKLAGKIAEEIVYGANTVTSGPAGDLKDATLIARNMVMEYGMGAKGSYIAYEYLRDVPENEVNQQVQAILNECAQNARKILENNRAKLDKLAKTLLEKEVLNYEDVIKIMK